MRGRALIGTAAIVAIVGFTPVAAQSSTSDAQAMPEQVRRLIACRDIADSGQRLACFGREVGTTAQAVASRELVVVDREGVRRAKRTLFGLSIPKFGIFDGDGEQISQIEGQIEGVGRNGDGGYVLLLQDGSRWSQIDGRPIAIEPERGDKVVVKRAALGSFMLSVAKQPGVRVKRVN